MSREILGQVDDEFSLLDEEGPSVDSESESEFESSIDNIKLQKVIKEYKQPAKSLSLSEAP